MLENLKAITNYGVFSNFSPAGGELSFLKFNLFYGWNGTGKTTLSRVFDSFSGQQSSAFPSGDYKVTIQNANYSRESIARSGMRIATFNQDFVRKNLDFDTHKAKSILYISEEKIEERKKLERKQEDLEAIRKDLDEKLQESKKIDNEIESDLSRIAKNVKNSFGLIQTTNTKFLNYDKRKLQEFISKNAEKIKSESILSADGLAKSKLSTQSSQKSELQKLSLSLNIEDFESSLGGEITKSWGFENGSIAA